MSLLILLPRRSLTSLLLQIYKKRLNLFFHYQLARHLFKMLNIGGALAIITHSLFRSSQHQAANDLSRKISDFWGQDLLLRYKHGNFAQNNVLCM